MFTRLLKTTKAQPLRAGTCSECGGSGYSHGGQCEKCEGTGRYPY